jgi:hypothetical protein
MRQLELFSRAQLSVLRDRTRARNYSPEADAFRRAHERHRAWGLRQRHAQKMIRLYGSTANAWAEFRRCAEERTLPSAGAGLFPPEQTTVEQVTAAPAAPEPVTVERPAPEPHTALQATPEQVTAAQATPEPVAAERASVEATVPEPTGSEPTGSEPTGSEPTGSEPTGSEPAGSEPRAPECGQDGVGGGDPSSPSLSGNSGPRPARRRSRSGRPVGCRPGQCGRHRGSGWRGIHRPARPESARHIRPESAAGPSGSRARKESAATGGKDAFAGRGGYRLRPVRTVWARLEGCREQVPP